MMVILQKKFHRLYKSLDHYDNTGDITPYLNYMKKSLEKTWVLGELK